MNYGLSRQKVVYVFFQCPIFRYQSLSKSVQHEIVTDRQKKRVIDRLDSISMDIYVYTRTISRVKYIKK